MATLQIVEGHTAIANGPSKAALKDALFEGRHVEFTLADGQKIEVALRTISAEDGSFERWLIGGYIVHKEQPTRPWERFKGFFKTKDRSGFITRVALEKVT